MFLWKKNTVTYLPYLPLRELHKCHKLRPHHFLLSSLSSIDPMSTNYNHREFSNCQSNRYSSWYLPTINSSLHIGILRGESLECFLCLGMSIHCSDCLNFFYLTLPYHRSTVIVLPGMSWQLRRSLQEGTKPFQMRDRTSSVSLSGEVIHELNSSQKLQCTTHSPDALSCRRDLSFCRIRSLNFTIIW